VRALGGKVLVPTSQHIRKLNAARLAADVLGVPTLLLARTDAAAAQLLTSDIDERDQPFATGERTPGRLLPQKPGNGKDHAIARGLAYAPYADLIWCETSEARPGTPAFAEAIHAEFPGKLLAYNCSPSFNWKKKMTTPGATFQKRNRRHGLQVPVHHPGRLPRPEPLHVQRLARGYARRQMSAFVELQEAEFAAADRGFTAVKHQREVGTGYFDAVTQAIQQGQSSTTALTGSTEEEQFRAA
jgi:isocitrate lyase